MASCNLWSLPDRSIVLYYAIQQLGTTDVTTLAALTGKCRVSIYRALADLRKANLIQSGITMRVTRPSLVAA